MDACCFYPSLGVCSVGCDRFGFSGQLSGMHITVCVLSSGAGLSWPAWGSQLAIWKKL